MPGTISNLPATMGGTVTNSLGFRDYNNGAESSNFLNGFVYSYDYWTVYYGWNSPGLLDLVSYACPSSCPICLVESNSCPSVDDVTIALLDLNSLSGEYVVDSAGNGNDM